MISKEEQKIFAAYSIKDSTPNKEIIKNEYINLIGKDPFIIKENLNKINIQSCEQDNFKSAKKVIKPTNINLSK